MIPLKVVLRSSLGRLSLQKKAKEEDPRENDLAELAGQLVVEGKRNKHGERKRPGRIEGPWFSEKLHSLFHLHHTRNTKSLPDSQDGKLSGGFHDGTQISPSNVEVDFIAHPTVILGRENYAEEETGSSQFLSNISEEERQHMGSTHEMKTPKSTTSLAPRSSNVFTKMSTSFTNVKIDRRGYINTPEFLDACKEIITILDLMGGRAFGPVKSDLNGNISKLRSHYEVDPQSRGTLQDMILREMAAGKLPPGSATEALLWLKRSLSFVDEFLRELLATDEGTKECAHRAYKTSLEQYHSFVVRTAFQVAIYALPSRKEFIATLADKKERVDDPVYVEKLMKNADDYSKALKRIVVILNAFYADNKLE